MCNLQVRLGSSALRRVEMSPPWPGPGAISVGADSLAVGFDELQLAAIVKCGLLTVGASRPCQGLSRDRSASIDL